MIKKLITWLDNISLFCLGGMVFLVPFSSHYVRRFFFFGFGCLIICKILKWKAGVKPLFKKNYLNIPILIFISAMLVATLLGGNIYESQKVFIERILFYMGIFFLIKEIVNTKKKVYFLLGAVSVSAFLVGIDAMWQYFTGFDLFFGYPKNDPYVGKAIALSGPFGSYNFFSSYLEISTPLIVFISLVQKKKKYIATFFWVIVAMLLLSWVYVFERATWFSVWLSLFIVFLWIKNKYASIFFIVSSMAIILLLPTPAYQRIWSTFKENGDTGRFRLWKEGSEAFNSSPLIGYGLGGYSRYSYPGYLKELQGDNNLNLGYTGSLHVHNTYLELLVDSGLMGLLSFLYLWGVFLRRSFFSLSNIVDETKKLVLGGLIASCLSCFIAGLFSTNMIVGVGMSALFWTIFTLVAVLPEIAFEEQ